MAATGLYMNWVNVSVTPQGGSAIPINGVMSLSVMKGSRQEAFYGDALQFARMLKNVEKQRSITINGGNLGALATIPDDAPCTVSGTLLDPKNGSAAGGGAFAVTLVNAVLEKNESSGQNNKYAGGSVTFKAYGGSSQDGAEVDPLTYTLL